MKRNRGNKFKTGVSLVVVLVVMGGIMALLGFTAVNWYFDYTSGPQEELETVDSNQIVKEEEIDPQQEESSENGSSSAEAEPQEEDSVQEKNVQQSSSTSTESEPTNVSQSADKQNLFAVQVGAFSEKSNAQGLVNKLQKKGFTAYITSEEPYRVQAGAFRTEKAAQELSSKLKKEGFSVYIKD
ncbi:SPOR domain-containing protein [Halanaerobaculum tunisiense]